MSQLFVWLGPGKLSIGKLSIGKPNLIKVWLHRSKNTTMPWWTYIGKSKKSNSHLQRQVAGLLGPCQMQCQAPFLGYMILTLTAILTVVLQQRKHIRCMHLLLHALHVCTWAARYNTWLLIKSTLKGVVFSFHCMLATATASQMAFHA